MTARATADQLLLSAGKLAGIKIFLGDDLEMVERFGHHALPLTARNVFVGERQIDVLLHRQVVEQVIALEDHADIALGQFGALLALHRVHGLLAKPVLACPLVVEQGEHIQQRRLPRSRRPHDGDELAFAGCRGRCGAEPRSGRLRFCNCVRRFSVGS